MSILKKGIYRLSLRQAQTAFKTFMNHLFKGSLSPNMVGLLRLELRCITATVSKTVGSTNFPIIPKNKEKASVIIIKDTRFQNSGWEELNSRLHVPNVLLNQPQLHPVRKKLLFQKKKKRKEE